MRINFFHLLGLALAIVITIGIWFSTGVLQPQPNIFTAK